MDQLGGACAGAGSLVDLGDNGMRGIDYSWARPGGKAIREAGFEFVMRYVPYPGDGGKGLTSDEIADLRANGLAIGLVFESTSGRMLEGEAAGVEDGNTVAQSVAAIGFPDILPIYFACDFDAVESQFVSLDAYLKGVASVLGQSRVGIYGSFAVIEHCHEVGSAMWLWQTYAWSGGHVSDWAHIFQNLNGQTLNGGAVDYNAAAREFGQWKTEEDDVTKEQLEDLWLAIASGQEEASLDRATRVANAGYRIGQIVAGERPSMLELAYETKGRMDAFTTRTVPGIAGDQ